MPPPGRALPSARSRGTRTWPCHAVWPLLGARTWRPGLSSPLQRACSPCLGPNALQVRAFRVLEQEAPANGVAVAAPTMGQTISPRLRLPLPKGCRMGVPR